MCHTDMLPEHMTARGHGRHASSQPKRGGDREAVHRWAPRGAGPLCGAVTHQARHDSEPD
jgi:hypothetical protein